MDDPFFTPEELARLALLVHDPSLRPSFEFLRAALVWEDESPQELPSPLHVKLTLLFAARSCLHQQKPLGGERLNQQALGEVWEKARREAPGWPGFRRLELSPEDQTYLDEWLRESQQMAEEIAAFFDKKER